MRDICYKLTRPDLTTHGGFLYQVGREYVFSGRCPLCTSEWTHAYLSPETAALHNPVHAAYDPAILWRCECVIDDARDGQMKVGCSRLRLMEEIPLPRPTPDQCAAYAIACAWPVASDEWRTWARAWLDGTDRSYSSAARAAARVALNQPALAALAAARAAARVALNQPARAALAAARAAMAAQAAAASDAPLVRLASWALSLDRTDVIVLPEWAQDGGTAFTPDAHGATFGKKPVDSGP